MTSTGLGLLFVVFYLTATPKKTWTQSLAVQNDNVEVSIERTLMLGPDTLMIILDVKNLSATQKRDFWTWVGNGSKTSRDFATLTDNFNNEYKLYPITNDGVYPESLYPGNSISESLQFEHPSQNVKWLHLELPAGNFGGNGMIRFEIPIDRVEPAKK